MTIGLYLLLGFFLLVILAALVIDGINREISIAHQKFKSKFEDKNFIDVWLETKENLEQLKIAEKAKQLTEPMQKFIDHCQKIIDEGLTQLIEKLIWINGGALAACVTLIASGSFHGMIFKNILSLSIIFFSWSLVLSVMSLVSRIISHIAIINTKHASDRMFDQIQYINSEFQKKSPSTSARWMMKYKIEEIWNDFIGQGTTARGYGSLSDSLLHLALAFFPSGILSFVAFGSINTIMM